MDMPIASVIHAEIPWSWVNQPSIGRSSFQGDAGTTSGHRITSVNANSMSRARSTMHSAESQSCKQAHQSLILVRGLGVSLFHVLSTPDRQPKDLPCDSRVTLSAVYLSPVTSLRASEADSACDSHLSLTWIGTSSNIQSTVRYGIGQSSYFQILLCAFYRHQPQSRQVASQTRPSKTGIRVTGLNLIDFKLIPSVNKLHRTSTKKNLHDRCQCMYLSSMSTLDPSTLTR
jgi:hypothetical protein